MKIKMLVSISGAGFSLSRGDETERFPEKDALNLIKTGAAVLVDQTGQEPAGSGDTDNSPGENSTENAGAADYADTDSTGSADQTDAAQSASGKGKGKAD